MDEWVPEDSCRRDDNGPQLPQAEFTNRKRKRKRDVNYSLEPSALHGFALRGCGEDKGSPMPTEIVMTEEDFDLQHHQQLRAQRNFDVVIFDVWKIKPWWVLGAYLSFWSVIRVLHRYYSPYPLVETEPDDPASSSSQSYHKIPGVPRATPRSHGRTSDLLAGGLGRHHSGEATLWVCHFCFKYMVDGIPWESHKVGLYGTLLLLFFC